VRHLAELHGLPRREATSRASDALWEVGLGEERFRPVGTMSTGQRQRVKLAQAIVHDPELLLLDEPTNGLDPSQREDMLGLIEHVGVDLGMHVIVSSHLLDEVERVSASVVILESGRVVADGSMAELSNIDPELVVELDRLNEVDPAPALASTLQRAGLVAAADGPRRLVVALGAPSVYDAVRNALADGGYSIRKLERRTASLEDVYLASAGTGPPE
jgi:ABC-2 type transport system ATP-binding protein